MGPRLFGIPAPSSPIVAIVRRGPSDWSQLISWDPTSDSLIEGSWLHGTIYPQRSDISPDGRWFAAFILKGNARWDIGDTYLSISRLPWLTALAAWSTCGTWTRGLHFVDRAAHGLSDAPDHGELEPLRRRFGLAATRPETFSVERRGGWTESATTPERRDSDHWDEDRAELVVMERARPGASDDVLSVSGRHAAFRSFSPAWGEPSYELRDRTRTRRLDGVQWADWSADGRLLVATSGGHLQVRVEPFGGSDTVADRDLSGSKPDPAAPPTTASEW